MNSSGRIAAAESAHEPIVRRRWGALIAHPLTIILGLWIAVAVIYWPSSAALDGIWRGSAGNTYTLGYLVLIASLWLTVRRRDELAATPVRPLGWAWILVVLLSVSWLWSWRAAIQVLHVVLLPAILAAALVAALGWRRARLSLFPVGLLLFAMPIWDAVNDSLQTLSAHLNGILIWLSGISVYMQGDLIRLPAGTIEVAQACSGLNAFITGLTVAAIYGEVARDSLRRRLAWFGLMGILALAANAVRIFVVTVAAYETNMQSSLVRHHIWLGWCIFAGAVVVFLMIAGRLADVWDRRGPPEARRAPAEKGQRTESARPHHRAIGRVAVALVCLGLLPALSYGVDLVRSGTQSALVIHWPQAPEGWQGPMPDTVSEWSPRFANPTAESLRIYVDPGARPVEVFAAAYRTQTQDAKLLGFQNDLLGSSNLLQARSQGVVDSPAGKWRETVAVDRTGARSLIWWRYRIGHRIFIKPRLSQFWYGLEALTGSPPVSSLTALRATCSADCSAARELLADVAARLQPAVLVRPAITEAKAR